MTIARQNFFGWWEDRFRALGRRSLIVPKTFNSLANWCGARAR